MSNYPEFLLFKSRHSSDGAVEIFFTHWNKAPGKEDEARLCELLRADLRREKFTDDDGFIVMPRWMTISPWSSKATRIAHRCGLCFLDRLERGWWYPQGNEVLAEKVHDSMREQVKFGRSGNAWGLLFYPAPADSAGCIPLFSENENGWELSFSPTLLGTSGYAPLMSDNSMAESLEMLNESLDLALTAQEVEYLAALYTDLQRPPTVSELMMFAQANSEHCRHKIFNALWRLGGVGGAGGAGGENNDAGRSLMDFIRDTHRANPSGVVTAFNDNAAIIEGGGGGDFAPNPDQGDVYQPIAVDGGLYLVAKAETHNHPTAISPYPGAATGSGGEIRDEAAAGRGAAARAGFSGYIVSELDGAVNPPPPHIATARQIMTEAPIGAAAYNNEFGRPALAGFFRSYQEARGKRCFGFHKPVMLAGGIGHMLPHAAGKKPLSAGDVVVQLGGEGFRIGIGGGAASSRSGGGDAELDFASVQRDNAEMQRRAQQVLEHFRRLPGEDNPILSLHDVGAGGLANAVSELVHSAGCGAKVDLGKVPVKESGMSAAEVWCNESQERYVLALNPARWEEFERVCKRECCPVAAIGEVTDDGKISATYEPFNEVPPVDLPLDKVLDVPHRLQMQAQPLPAPAQDGSMALARERFGNFSEAAMAVLRHPTVACKRFLVTIGDRTVGGLTAREQMVGPWQTPVADCAAICHDYEGFGGAAFALGERAAAAAVQPAAAVRLAISEALLNLFAADVELQQVKMSLNWMANCADEERGSELYAAVQAASEFCVALKVGVIVGKDSLFMRMNPAEGAAGGAAGIKDVAVESPAFAAAFSFAPMADVRRIATPQLSGEEDTVLLQLRLVAPSLGGSIAAQVGVFSPPPAQVPDVSPAALAAALRVIAQCRAEDLLLAYHDCSDGGLWAALCEMAFAANCGMDIFADTIGDAAPETDGSGGDGWAAKAAVALFHEAPAAVLEVADSAAARVMEIAAEVAETEGIAVQTVARPRVQDKTVCVYGGGDTLLKESLADLRRIWEAVGADIASQRDNPKCVAEEAARDMDGDGGLFARLPETLPDFAAPAVVGAARPRVAVLREVGTNGQREMAAVFTSAGFEAVDVTMQDLLEGRHRLDDGYSGAVLCGGFSYGDVLGAGRGWALSILNNESLREMFSRFFARADTLTLGVCNGCQALAHLQTLMPRAEEWRFPDFLLNESRRFEARLSMVEVLDSPSPFLRDMAGLQFPIVVSHGEGRAAFAENDARTAAATVMRYVDNNGEATMRYPANPNGSPKGTAGFCSPDGRITLMMPHPERVYRRVQMAWQPPLPPQYTGEYTPWQLLFANAHRFAEAHRKAGAHRFVGD